MDFNSFRANPFATKTKTRSSGTQKWQVLHLGVLREYLELDMRPPQASSGTLGFAYDGERVVDDFVLLAALCGNDFMP